MGELLRDAFPGLAHATVIANLITMLIPLNSRLGGLWRTGPVDVFFPDANPVQPDIIVLLPGGSSPD